MAANVQRTIDIIFAGVDNVSGTINTVSGGMSDFADGIKDVTSPLADITDNILKIDAALLALGAGGLAFAFAKSIEFEGSMIELKKVMGDQPQALKEASDAALKLSNQYGDSSSNILLSTAEFKQAGFDIQESMQLTKNAMDLSIAGNVGASEASELLISTLKGFKVPATEATRLVDILNEVSNNYAVNVKELGIGMATLSPIASLMGFSFEETAGVLTPVIEIFRSGNEAAVSLKTGLLRLVDDQKPVRDALKSIGVAQRDANGSLRSGKDILLDVATAFKTVDENEKLFLATSLVGVHQAGKMVEVFNGLAKSSEVTSVALGAAGSAALEVAARLESGEVAVKRFMEGFINLSIVIGDQFKDSAKKAIDGGTEIENALQQIVSDGTFAPVFDALSDFGDEIGKYLSDIAVAMPEAFENVDWSSLLSALENIGLEFGNFFENIDLTKPEDLTKVIQFVIDSLESLVTVTEGIIGPLGKFMQTVMDGVETFNNLDDSSKKATGSVLGWGKVVNSIIAPIQGILGAFEGLATALTALTAIRIGTWATGIIPAITAFSASMGPLGLVGAAGAAGAAIGTLARKAFPQIDEGAQKLIGFFDQLLGISEFKPETELKILDAEFEASIRKNKERLENLNKIKIQTEIDMRGLDDFIATIQQLPAVTQMELVAAWKEGNFDEIDKILMGFTSGKEITFDEDKTKQNAAEVVEITSKEIEKIPSEKELEIRLKGDIAAEIENIKAHAETIQAAMEWRAKVDIAEAEAAAKTIEAAFDSVGTSIQSTGETLVGLANALTGLDTSTRWKIEAEIVKESARRDAALDMQEKLTTAQVEYMDARKDALQRGDALITIDSSGLEPHLEAFMWEVLSKVQTRVIEEQSDFLLGIA